MQTQARNILFAVVLTALIVGGGAYAWQQNEKPTSLQTPSSSAQTPKTSTETSEPLSYSMTGVSATVSKEIKPFAYTAPTLASMAEECGTTHDTNYFEKLVETFQGRSSTVYTFTYTDKSQDDSQYIVTLLPNAKKYSSVDQFKKDFDICAAGGNAYPKMISKDWLLFVNSCGTGFDDGSGQPHGCEAMRTVIEPTLKLN